MVKYLFNRYLSHLVSICRQELLIDQVEDIYSLSMAYGLHVFIHNATERFTMYDGSQKYLVIQRTR